MKKYSRVYVHKYTEDHSFRFRYNHETHNVEYIFKPDKEALEMERDDAENCKLDWLREEAAANLKNYEETGYMVISTLGCSEDDWRESRDYAMDMMSEEIMCEINSGILKRLDEKTIQEVEKLEDELDWARVEIEIMVKVNGYYAAKKTLEGCRTIPMLERKRLILRIVNEGYEQPYSEEEIAKQRGRYKEIMQKYLRLMKKYDMEL